MCLWWGTYTWVQMSIRGIGLPGAGTPGIVSHPTWCGWSELNSRAAGAPHSKMPILFSCCYGHESPSALILSVSITPTVTDVIAHTVSSLSFTSHDTAVEEAILCACYCIFIIGTWSNFMCSVWSQWNKAKSQNEENPWNCTNWWRPNNTYQMTSHWRNQREMRKSQRQWKWEHNPPKATEYNKCSSKGREFITQAPSLKKKSEVFSS